MLFPLNELPWWLRLYIKLLDLYDEKLPLSAAMMNPRGSEEG